MNEGIRDGDIEGIIVALGVSDGFLLLKEGVLVGVYDGFPVELGIVEGSLAIKVGVEDG